MELLRRLKRVTQGHIEERLATFEDPEVIIPQLVREMEEQVRLAREAEVQTLADRKLVEKECVDLRARLSRLEQGAQAALRRDEQEMARGALAAQLETEGALVARQAALARVEERVTQAHATRQRRQAELDEIRTKKVELVARARTTRLQARGARAADGAGRSSSGILDTLGAMESKVRAGEADLDSRNEVAGQERNLDRHLEGLEREAEIERRLEALKARSSGA